jgi:hypothetical protein
MKPDITMVAFHGEGKPASLMGLLEGTISMLQSFGEKADVDFERYETSQVHMTLLGMECDDIGGVLYGHWFFENSGLRRRIHLPIFRRVLVSLCCQSPLFRIRIGGFQKSRCKCRWKRPWARATWICDEIGSRTNVRYHSYDRSHYEASFYVAGRSAMLTGWTVESEERPCVFTRSAYEFRREAGRAGLLDKYHGKVYRPHRDDDCAFKVGTFSRRLPQCDQSDIQTAVRDHLAGREPVVLDVGVEDIDFVLYEKPSLDEIISTRSLVDCLGDFSKLEELFEELLERRAGAG